MDRSASGHSLGCICSAWWCCRPVADWYVIRYLCTAGIDYAYRLVCKEYNSDVGIFDAGTSFRQVGRPCRTEWSKLPLPCSVDDSVEFYFRGPSVVICFWRRTVVNGSADNRTFKLKCSAAQFSALARRQYYRGCAIVRYGQLSRKSTVLLLPLPVQIAVRCTMSAAETAEFAALRYVTGRTFSGVS